VQAPPGNRFFFGRRSIRSFTLEPFATLTLTQRQRLLFGVLTLTLTLAYHRIRKISQQHQSNEQMMMLDAQTTFSVVLATSSLAALTASHVQKPQSVTVETVAEDRAPVAD
jgi:hypothetical protein